MKSIQTTIAILLLSIFTISCSKEDEKSAQQEDCVSKNHGIITVNYTKLTDRHAIDISKVGDQIFFKSKISGLSIAKDTVHLKPGNYIIKISRINQNNQSLEDHPSVNASVTQCSDLFINTQI